MDGTQNQRPDKMSPKEYVPLLAATIAAIASLSTVFITWFLIERVRTDISQQTLALERVKVEVAAAAQRTAEMGLKIDQSRLELDRRIAQSTESQANRRIQIEDKRYTTNEARLTPYFAKLSNDLRPNLQIDCLPKREEPALLLVDCRFENKGAYRITVTPKTVEILDKVTEKGIAGAISSFDNANANTILTGGLGSNTYTIRLTQTGAALKQGMLSFVFTAVTDQVAINMTKRLAKGILTDEELKQLSEQSYTNWINLP